MIVFLASGLVCCFDIQLESRLLERIHRLLIKWCTLKKDSGIICFVVLSCVVLRLLSVCVAVDYHHRYEYVSSTDSKAAALICSNRLFFAGHEKGLRLKMATLGGETTPRRDDLRICHHPYPILSSRLFFVHALSF
jgi:hypothetical protein